MDQAETRESSGLLVENIKIMQRVWKYLDELQAKGLTKVEEEQKLVKRRAAQISLEIQGMKDNLRKMVIYDEVPEEVEDVEREDTQCPDPSIQVFGIEWKVVLRKCRWINKELNMMLEHLAEENTIDSCKNCHNPTYLLRYTLFQPTNPN